MKKEAVQEERGLKQAHLPSNYTNPTPPVQSQSGWCPPPSYAMQTRPQVTIPAVNVPVSYQFLPPNPTPPFVAVPVTRPGFVIYPTAAMPLEQQQKIQQQFLDPVNHHAPQSVSPEGGRDSGIDSNKDDDSTASEVFLNGNPSSPESSKCSSVVPELVGQSTSGLVPPAPTTRPPKEEGSMLEQIKKESKEVPSFRKESFISGPDAPLVDLDLDELCKTHRLVHTLPEEKKATPQAVNIGDLIAGGKATFGLFVKWIKGIPLFCEIPPTERVACVKACYIEQMILTIIYRSLILQSEGMVLTSGKEFKPEEVDNALVSYSIGRIMGELMGAFKSLDLDYKEFICLRLLFLFNPDSPEVESPVKEHIGRIQNVVLVALEDYCTDQHPTTPLRYSKLLLSMASMRSISKEMTQESEVQTALATANFDSSQLFKFLDF
jgi:hypothetical protein